jgi:hypothetical protein
MHKTQKMRKGIIFILISLLIGISVFFYYYLISIDRKYSKIITTESGSNRGYLLLYKIIETRDRTKRDSLYNERHSFGLRNDSLINDILYFQNMYGDKSSLMKIISSRKEYANNCAIFKSYITNDKKDSANDVLINKIEPSFLKYQNELISFIDSNTINVLEHSGNITSDVKRHSFFVLLFGLSPIIIFTIFLIILGVFLVLMIFFLKDIEYDR